MSDHCDPLEKIEIASTLIAFHEHFGVTDSSHHLLIQILHDQSPDQDEDDLEKAWKSQFAQSIAGRKSKARKLYRRFQKLPAAQKDQLERQRIADFPETSYARTVRRKLGL